MVTLVGYNLLIVQFASAMICFELLLNYIRVVIIKIQNYIQNKPKLYMGWMVGWVRVFSKFFFKTTLFNWLFFSLIFFYYHRIWKLLNVACNNITNLLWNWKIVRKENEENKKKNMIKNCWRVKKKTEENSIIFFSEVIECFSLHYFLGNFLMKSVVHWDVFFSNKQKYS